MIDERGGKDYMTRDGLRIVTPEIASAYPNAQRAICLFSGIVDDTRWEMLKESVLSREGIERFISVLASQAISYSHRDDTEDKLFFVAAAREFYSDDFSRYLQAKLGMV